ncbi:hypothetical protein CPC08DRAFT_47583 [Agrocybe pediades]|nr:hypothetical protein CPC08DRAFT_47583 [Agrocybe pediades]
MLVFKAATADEVLKEIEEQEECERCRIAVAKKAPRGEWASLKKDPRHGEPPPNPRSRVVVIDNVRVILILILTMYNTVLETISNHPGDIEKDHPTQFAILSLFTGIYRVIGISLFFYVSGLSSWILLTFKREPPLQFLLKKSRKTLLFTIGCYIASKAAEYVYGPFPENSSGPTNTSYYASREGKISLLRGPIYYSVALLILDAIFVFCRVIHRNYWRYDLIERLVGTKHRFRVTSVLVPVVVMGICPLLLLCGYITLPRVPARLQPFFLYIHLDAQTPFSSILAYAAAVNQCSFQLQWSRPDGKLIKSRLIMITFRNVLIYATAILIGLYHYYPSTIARYISPNLPPRPLFDSALTSASTFTPAVLYLAWAEHIYRLLLVTFGSTFHIRGIQNYYLFTRMAPVQTIIHMFFIIGIARHSSWIGSPVLRCIFVGSSFILCAWIAGLLFLYYRAKLHFSGEPVVAEPAEQEREKPIKETELTHDVESDSQTVVTPEAASTSGETPVNVVEQEGGEGSKVLASAADVEEKIQEAPPGSGGTVVGEAIRECINGTTSLHSYESATGDDTVHNKDTESTAEDRGGEADKKTVQEHDDSHTMKNPQAEGHSVTAGVKREQRTKKIVLTVNIARAFLIFLLTLHTSVMAVVTYLPEGFQSSSPRYFAAISLFSAFHQAAVIPAFFFLSGISSYLSLSTKYLKRSSFWLPWDRLLALFFVTDVNSYLLTTSISQLDRVWPPTPVPVRSPDTSLAARKPEDLLQLRRNAPTTYILLLILLDFGYCALRTVTRQSKRLTGLVSGHRFYFTLQGIALCAQLVLLCATLAGKDPFFSQGFAWKWKLDAHFPLLYINAYAMGVNLSHFHATFFAGPSRRTWKRAVSTAIVQTVIAYAILWTLYRGFPSQIQVYIDPRFHPHPVLDARTSMSQKYGWHTQAAVIGSYACWSMATFLLLTASIAAFILSSDQSELVSKGPKSTRYYAVVLRKAFWYSFFHAAPAVALAGRTSWIKDIGVRIIFVMFGSVMFVSALVRVIAWLMSWPPVKLFVVRVVLGAKLLI